MSGKKNDSVEGMDDRRLMEESDYGNGVQPEQNNNSAISEQDAEARRSHAANRRI